ncbi:hypothetical protein [Rosistilla ulvae]|nr:hypothetical protein [Rosistilla ulvae]
MSSSRPLPSEAQLQRLVFAIRDLNHANSAIQFLLEECDFSKSYPRLALRKFKLLESAAIVAFGRLFSVSGGGTTPSFRLAGIRFSPADERIKKRIMDLRNTTVAHSDEEMMHYRVDLIRPMEDNLELAMPHLQIDDTLHLDENELGEFDRLVRELVYKYVFDISQTHPELVEKYVTPAASASNGG